MFDENFYAKLHMKPVVIDTKQKLQLEEEAQQQKEQIVNEGLETALSGDHDDYSEGNSISDSVRNVALVW